MNQRYFFSDTASGELTYTGDVTVDASFDPSEAETVTLDTKWEQFFGTDEYVQFAATVAQPIVQPYFHDGELQKFKKDEQELKTAQAQLDNIEGTVTHPPQDRVTSADQIRAFWSDPEWTDGQDLTLNIPANDPEAVRAAVQKDEVSVGFSGTLDYTDDDTATYDAVQRDITYDHVAFGLESGRCSNEDGCGLHTDGVDQHGHTDAVATKLTEEDGTHSEMNPTYSVGDWVQWDWSGGTATGRIKSVHTDGPVSVSGTKRNPSDEGGPVYKINHWDGDEFGNDKIAYESNLSSTSKPENFTDGCALVCSIGPCSCGAHDPFSDVSVNGEDIDLVPPEAAQNAAQQALDAREDDDVEVNGMQSHGWNRAEQLASGEGLSPSDIVGSTGAMAPWWSRHEQYSISGESLKESETDNPWEDNSYTAGKGWGGYSGYRWAIAKGNEIKRARGEEPTYGDSQHTPDGIYVENGDWYGVAPSETSDDEPKYELNNCNDVQDAFNLRNNGDYQISTDALITRIQRASDAHDCPTENKPWTDSDTTMTIQEFVDENELTAEDVRYIIDSADVDEDALVDAPEEPTDFYDGEPDVETLADDFDTVDLLVDEKTNLEDEVDSLQDELHESQRPVFADKAERLAEMTQKWGDEDALMDKFDAEDDEQWTVDTIGEKIELVEDITGTETTTVTDSGSSDSTEPEIDTTRSGKFDLRNKTTGGN